MGYHGTLTSDRRLGDLRLVDKRHRAGEVLGWHVHETAYVTFVIRGGYRERMREACDDCGPSSAILHPPGERHADVFGNRNTRLLDVELGGRFLYGTAGHAFLDRRVLQGHAIRHQAARLERELKYTDDVSPLVAESVMLEIAVEALRSSGNGRRPPAWLREAETIVRDRFHQRLGLSDIACELDVAPGQLARAFRHHRNETVGDAIRRHRVEYAKQRMSSRSSLAKIALDAGFADQSHFTRTFLRFTGVSPAAYRKRIGERAMHDE
jgi:AraC family transcriptional regulator